MQSEASLACLSAAAVKIKLLLMIKWSPVSRVGWAFSLMMLATLSSSRMAS